MTKIVIKKNESKAVGNLARILQTQVELKRKVEANNTQKMTTEKNLKNLVDEGRLLALQYRKTREQAKVAQKKVNENLLSEY